MARHGTGILVCVALIGLILASGISTLRRFQNTGEVHLEKAPCLIPDATRDRFVARNGDRACPAGAAIEGLAEEVFDHDAAAGPGLGDYAEAATPSDPARQDVTPSLLARCLARLQDLGARISDRLPEE